ncbi:HAD-IIIC family phosphatase [Prochlorococcus marinus]|uniref:HAD-IIIC family phosphatase n=1 Tax=Prochlorococcus marinus TaxID=1219 RepID=UPI0022B51D0B|nr:HAD-IIIC family phosphatase [Prochlorococcus marinus]
MSNSNPNDIQYPLSFENLLRNRRKIKKNLLTKEGLLEKKIAILGGSTTNELVQLLDILLLSRGIKGSFYESEYNKYYEDIMFEEEKLINFKPDLIYIFTNKENIKFAPKENTTDIDSIVLKELEIYKSLWDKIKNLFNCPIIQNNFDPPKFRPLGNLEVYSSQGLCLYINKLNLLFSEQAEARSDLYLCDINWLAFKVGDDKWNNLSNWYSYKYAIGLEGIPLLANNIASIISSIFGKMSKCLVLDLDNTLWGGVIGDDGVKGIEIGKETPIGEAYTDIQKYILELKRRGILLTISSKNNLDIALEGISHPENEIKKEDFSLIMADWERKDLNIIEIAKALNIGLNSLVFMDDNPAEREIVNQNIKGIDVPDIGEDFLQYISIIDSSGLFEPTSISKEDRLRNKMYQENFMRYESQKSISSYTEFLKSLEMKAEIDIFKDIYLDRITQLSNKTNQFNLTTKRYTYSEINEVSNNKNYLTLQGKLKDKFGENGLVSLIIAKIINNSAYIDLWLMSCRVLKRGMEDLMLNQAIVKAKTLGIKKIYGNYIPTSKNSMVKDLYHEKGFILSQSDYFKEGTIWSMETDRYNPIKTLINLQRSD